MWRRKGAGRKQSRLQARAVFRSAAGLIPERRRLAGNRRDRRGADGTRKITAHPGRRACSEASRDPGVLSLRSSLSQKSLGPRFRGDARRKERSAGVSPATGAAGEAPPALEKSPLIPDAERVARRAPGPRCFIVEIQPFTKKPGSPRSRGCTAKGTERRRLAGNRRGRRGTDGTRKITAHPGRRASSEASRDPGVLSLSGVSFRKSLGPRFRGDARRIGRERRRAET